MPLLHSKSKKAFSKNVEIEMEAGKPQKQALAVAYSVKRKSPKKKASGGTVESGSRDINLSEGGDVESFSYPHKPSEKGRPLTSQEKKENTSARQLHEGRKSSSVKESHDSTGLMSHIQQNRRPMADGGQVTAKTEKRPMPELEYQDKHEAARNAARKALVQDDWTGQPTLPQARKGLKTTPIKHPSMAQSPIIKARLRDDEDHLQTSAKVNNGPQIQPPKEDDELGPDRQGPKVPDMQREHNNGRKPYAAGGMAIEEDADDAKLRHEESDMEMDLAPSEDEGYDMALSDDELDQKRNGNRVPDMEDEHSTHRKPYAGGGEIGDDEENIDHEMDMNPAHDKHTMDDSEDQPMDEEMEEHHASITAAIMAKRQRMHDEIDSGAHDEDSAAMYADGGEIKSHDSWATHEDADQADLSRNADEDANEEDQMSFDALRKENYSESAGLAKMRSPRDSNEHGDDEESDSENRRDMVSAIRQKMASKRR